MVRSSAETESYSEKLLDDEEYGESVEIAGLGATEIIEGNVLLDTEGWGRDRKQPYHRGWAVFKFSGGFNIAEDHEVAGIVWNTTSGSLHR